MGKDGAEQTGPECVLWRLPTMCTSEALSHALRQRGIEARTETDPYAALARLCLVSAGGPRRGRPRPVLLLVEPERLPCWKEVAVAAGVYAPGAVCWAYHDGNPPSLAVLEVPHRPVEEPEVVVRGGERRAGDAQPLRLTEAGPGADRAGSGPSAAAKGTEPGPDTNAKDLLTEEELAMLLADETTGERRRGR